MAPPSLGGVGLALGEEAALLSEKWIQGSRAAGSWGLACRSPVSALRRAQGLYLGARATASPRRRGAPGHGVHRPGKTPRAPRVFNP